MTTRRRHTTRMMAAGLALGLLAGSVSPGTASAQAPGTPQQRYQARIAGAHVTFDRLQRAGDGVLVYSYTVDFGAALGLYSVDTGYRTTAATQGGNAFEFAFWRKELAHGRSGHRGGVWFVLARDGAICSAAAGTLWRGLVFDVSVNALSCAVAQADVSAEFAAVSARVGRHSSAAIPWPAALPKPRATATPLPRATATPVPAPTAPPAPAGATDQEGVTAQLTKLYVDDDGEFPPAAGNQYVVAHLVVVNGSDQNQTYNTFDFKLQDAEHVQYSGFALDSNVTNTALGSGTLAPGETVAGDIAFTVPAGETQFWLLWTPDFMQPALYLH